MSGRIVVGVDGSEESLAALRWAHQEAVLRDATLVAITAWNYPYIDAGMAGAPLAINPADLAEEARKTLEQSIETVVEDPAARERVERYIVEEPPAQALLQASEDADQIVIGSRGHGGFVGLLLGSVSNQVVHHAKVPVTVIRLPAED